MCGICGIAYRDRERRVEGNTLARMNDAMAHRGPDDHDLHLAGNVGLGHRRLSIVDLAGGHQPMSNEDGSVWIAFNGEIYNHADIRARMEAAGHRYATRSDTESIVHAHEELGPAGAAAALRGMFAYAIWDERARRLTLARDRVGIKPLYYSLGADGDLHFASEPAALLASGEVDPGVDEAALQSWFAQGHVPGEGTLFRRIRKLLPGTVLTWEDGRVSIGSFVEEEEPFPALGPADLDRAAEAFWERFCESVRLRLMSDVPVGIFLSGGLDSSLLVAAVDEIGHPALATFSVGYRHAEADEVPYATVVADRFQSRLEVVRVDEEHFFDRLPLLSRSLGQPLTHSASPPLYAVSCLARDHGVKVVLAGEGSDELFAGYGRYRKALVNHRLARLADRGLPDGARRALRTGLLGLPGVGGVRKLQRTFLARRGSLLDAYLDAFAVFGEEHRSRLLDGDPSSAYGGFEAYVDPAMVERAPLEAMLRLDQHTYLQELLAKQDHMSMAASIESRVPFLDHEFVHWARTLPASVKLRGARGKLLAKRAARGRLPDGIIDASKRGFLVPMARWFAEGGPARAMLEERLPDVADGPLRVAYVRELLREHAAGVDHATRLWSVLAFQLWREEFRSVRVPEGAVSAG